VPSEVGAGRLVGLVPAHDVRDGEGRVVVRKGTVLDAGAAGRLAALGGREVHLIEPEPGDVHEDPAGSRLAAAAAGEGVEVGEAAGGQRALRAGRRGLLRVDAAALAAVNAVEGVSVYTLYDGQVVDAGEVVGRAKITPLLIAEATVAEAERRARAARGLLAVRAFRPAAVAAVAPATLPPKVRARFEAALREKLDWFGARLVHLAFLPPEAPALAEGLRAALAGGAEVLVVGGANALDPVDPVFLALDLIDARVVRRGVPAHPGSLLWLARSGATPIVGMPSCGMFSQATLLDLILPRLLAGETVGAAELAALGHGGLLGREMAFRFPPYRAGQDRGALPE
jgi:molybdopterin biosynthesis enzyme